MKSIILIIPYFGNLPNYFQQFLISCKFNPTIDFLLLTNDKTEFDYPENLRVIYTSFDDVQKRIKKTYDFKATIDCPFKLCDYRPAYGEIFKEYTQGYDFWGHCDTDLLFGDIRHFYTDEILEKYCKVGYLGHLTLYKNTPYINSFYRKSIKTNDVSTSIEPYKIAYSKNENIGFDEWMFDTPYNKIGEIFMHYNEQVYYEIHFADLTPYTRPFIESYFDPYTQKRTSKSFFYYTWSNGKLYAYKFFSKEKSERLYVHFLKRPMKVKESLNYENDYGQMLIIPNEIHKGCQFLSFADRVKIIIMNILNPERCNRLFWVLCGKIIKCLRKIGLWKKGENKV